MKRSTDRILTTHVGSLVRPAEITEMILKRTIGEEIDEQAFDNAVSQGVKDVLRKQAEVGIDVPSDGEYSKESFSGYITERLGGLETRTIEKKATGPMNYPLLVEEFPGFMEQYNQMYRKIWMPPSISVRPRGPGRAGAGR